MAKKVTVSEIDVDEPGEAAPAVVKTELIDQIKAKINSVTSLERDLVNITNRKADIEGSLRRLRETELPDLFDQAGVQKIDIPAFGNYPAVSAQLRKAYGAGISASWDDERRQAAFDWLDKNGHGSLIKTTITVSFDRDDRSGAKKFLALLRKNKIKFEVKSSVHSGTLTKWLRDQVERVKKMPPLETIGGFVGKEVKIKQET